MAAASNTNNPDLVDQIPLLLLSGMGADEQLFESQFDEFPQLRVPAWIEPLRRESLRSYAARLARAIDPGRPCFVGGASFGGLVALEMIPHLQAKACFLIGSVRSPRELPWRWRTFWPLAKFGPDGLGIIAKLVARMLSPFLPLRITRRLHRFGRPEASFLRWASSAVLNWRPSETMRCCPVLQIHGEYDRTLPVHLTRPDVIVPGGGHMLLVTHPKIINQFLRNAIFEIMAKPASSSTRSATVLSRC